MPEDAVRERIETAMRPFDNGHVSGAAAIAELTREWDRSAECERSQGFAIAILDAAGRAGQTSPEAYAAAGVLRRVVDEGCLQQHTFRTELTSMLDIQLAYRPDDRYDLIRAAEEAPIGITLEHRLELINVVRRVGSHRAMKVAMTRTSPTRGGVAAPGVSPELATRAAVSGVAQWCIERDAFGMRARWLMLDLLTDPRLTPLVAEHLPRENRYWWAERVPRAIYRLERELRNGPTLTSLERSQAECAKADLERRFPSQEGSRW